MSTTADDKSTWPLLPSTRSEIERLHRRGSTAWEIAETHEWGSSALIAFQIQMLAVDAQASTSTNNWTVAEDDALLAAWLAFGADWNFISQILQKTPSGCKNRYEHLRASNHNPTLHETCLNPRHITRVAYIPSEDERIIEMNNKGISISGIITQLPHRRYVSAVARLRKLKEKAPSATVPSTASGDNDEEQDEDEDDDNEGEEGEEEDGDGDDDDEDDDEDYDNDGDTQSRPTRVLRSHTARSKSKIKSKAKPKAKPKSKAKSKSKAKPNPKPESQPQYRPVPTVTPGDKMTSSEDETESREKRKRDALDRLNPEVIAEAARAAKRRRVLRADDRRPFPFLQRNVRSRETSRGRTVYPSVGRRSRRRAGRYGLVYPDDVEYYDNIVPLPRVSRVTQTRPGQVAQTNPFAAPSGLPSARDERAAARAGAASTRNRRSERDSARDQTPAPRAIGGKVYTDPRTGASWPPPPVSTEPRLPEQHHLPPFRRRASRHSAPRQTEAGTTGQIAGSFEDVEMSDVLDISDYDTEDFGNMEGEAEGQLAEVYGGRQSQEPFANLFGNTLQPFAPSPFAATVAPHNPPTIMQSGQPGHFDPSQMNVTDNAVFQNTMLPPSQPPGYGAFAGMQYTQPPFPQIAGAGASAPTLLPNTSLFGNPAHTQSNPFQGSSQAAPQGMATTLFPGIWTAPFGTAAGTVFVPGVGLVPVAGPGSGANLEPSTGIDPRIAFGGAAGFGSGAGYGGAAGFGSGAGYGGAAGFGSGAGYGGAAGFGSGAGYGGGSGFGGNNGFEAGAQFGTGLGSGAAGQVVATQPSWTAPPQAQAPATGGRGALATTQAGNVPAPAPGSRAPRRTRRSPSATASESTSTPRRSQRLRSKR